MRTGDKKIKKFGYRILFQGKCRNKCEGDGGNMIGDLTQVPGKLRGYFFWKS